MATVDGVPSFVELEPGTFGKMDAQWTSAATASQLRAIEHYLGESLDAVESILRMREEKQQLEHAFVHDMTDYSDRGVVNEHGQSVNEQLDGVEARMKERYVALQINGTIEKAAGTVRNGEWIAREFERLNEHLRIIQDEFVNKIKTQTTESRTSAHKRVEPGHADADAPSSSVVGDVFRTLGLDKEPGQFERMSVLWSNGVTVADLKDIEDKLAESREAIKSIQRLMAEKQQREEKFVHDMMDYSNREVVDEHGEMVYEGGSGLQARMKKNYEALETNGDIEEAAGTEDVRSAIDSEFQALKRHLGSIQEGFLNKVRAQTIETSTSIHKRVKRDDAASASAAPPQSTRSQIEPNTYYRDPKSGAVLPKAITNYERLYTYQAYWMFYERHYEPYASKLPDVSTIYYLKEDKIANGELQLMQIPAGSDTDDEEATVSKVARTRASAATRPSVVAAVFHKLRLDKEGNRACSL